MKPLHFLVFFLADFIVVCMFNSDELDAAAEAFENYIQLGKHDIINCLSIGSRWVTCQYGLQVGQ